MRKAYTILYNSLFFKGVYSGAIHSTKTNPKDLLQVQKVVIEVNYCYQKAIFWTDFSIVESNLEEPKNLSLILIDFSYLPLQ